MEGLTPFLMHKYRSSQIAELNAAEANMRAATNVTYTEVTTFRARMKPQVPATFGELVNMLCRFGNLLYQMFTELCPLFVALDDLVLALQDWQESTQDKLTRKAMANLLWIVLKQSREFSMGSAKLLPCYQQLLTDVRASKTSIEHGETPVELYQNNTSLSSSGGGATGLSTSNKRETGKGGDPPNKKTKTGVEGNWAEWHQELKCVFAPALEKGQNPTYKKIWNYCGLPTGSLPGWREDSNLCVPYACIHKCGRQGRGRGCPRDHTRQPTSNEINIIKRTHKKFLDQPEGILG